MNEPTTPRRRFFQSLAGLATLVIAPLGWAASPAVLDNTHAAVRAVMAVQADVTASWMSIPAVLGTAVGLDDASQPVLVVFVDQEHGGLAAAIRSIPPQLRGVATKIELTEKFRAFKGPTAGAIGGGVSHKSKQTVPIQLGTSGGFADDLANGYCCGGTLGALVNIGGAQYILSNYHVFESDIVLGGNNLVAQTGSDIIQPGLIDVSCNKGDAQVVAKLMKKSSLPNSNVDCAVASVLPGMVDSSGSILEIGTISAQTVAAALNKAVKKSGRTTGLTKSTVSGLNATVSVAYENECAGGSAFTKTFTGQIVFANRGSKFLNSGDSGSVAVEDVTTNPRAVSLLFAGSSTSAIGNPINEVLSFLGATMVGN